MAKVMQKSGLGGLGKGLTDLFGGDALIKAEQDASVGISTISMTLIEPNPDQPRKIFEETALKELSESISKHGVITPITVRRQESGYYQIIAGERRWRASRMAGLTSIPAMVIDANDEKVMELALIENLQRQDLNPIEEAEGYEMLIKKFGMTQDKVSERVGKSRPAISNSLRLLTLNGQAREMLAEGKFTSGHARALLSIKDEALREQATLQMEGMSVRQAEILAKKLNSQPEEVVVEQVEVDYKMELEKQLENKLSRKVRIVSGKTHGTLSIDFYGDEDLERLSDAIGTVCI